MDAENQARLGEILGMPAADRGRKARAIIVAEASSRRLRVAMRPHWEKAITDPWELDLRGSLDDAMTPFQYADLAIACGYVDLDGTTRQTLHDALSPFFSDASVVGFMRDYDYDDVLRLAERVGVRPSTQPHPVEQCPMRFAAFFDIANTHDEDPNVEAFIARMDDYLEGDEEHEDYWDFLEQPLVQDRPPQDAGEEMMRSRTLGMLTFIQDYADFFKPLDARETRLFAMPIRYWLAKLFGYERDERGRWVHDEELDWASTLLEAPWVRDARAHEAAGDPPIIRALAELRRALDHALEPPRQEVTTTGALFSS